MFLVDDYGRDVLSIGDMGFYAGDSNTLNPNADFEPPVGGDFSYFQGNDYDDSFIGAGAMDNTAGDSSDSQLDSFSGFDSGDDGNGGFDFSSGDF
jgi:hypothetical protein